MKYDKLRKYKITIVQNKTTISQIKLSVSGVRTAMCKIQQRVW